MFGLFSKDEEKPINDIDQKVVAENKSILNQMAQLVAKIQSQTPEQAPTMIPPVGSKEL